MKRIFAIMLVIVMLLLSSCMKGSDKSSSSAPNDSVKAGAPATKDEATRDEPFNTIAKDDDYESRHFWHRPEKKINQAVFTEPLKKRSAMLDTEELYQNPELPTGCESVALTSALRTLGFNLEKTEFADEYLSYGDDVMWYYVGDPAEFDGAGIYPPGLTNCANDYLTAKKSTYTAYNTMGTEFENLYKLIDKGYPVLLWITMDYDLPVLSDVAFDYNGKYYYWYELEHCVMMCGYDLDEGTVTVNDPLEGIITVDAEELKAIYDEVDKLSMTIMR